MHNKQYQRSWYSGRKQVCLLFQLIWESIFCCVLFSDVASMDCALLCGYYCICILFSCLVTVVFPCFQRLYRQNFILKKSSCCDKTCCIIIYKLYSTYGVDSTSSQKNTSINVQFYVFNKMLPFYRTITENRNKTDIESVN